MLRSRHPRDCGRQVFSKGRANRAGRAVRQAAAGAGGNCLPGGGKVQPRLQIPMIRSFCALNMGVFAMDYMALVDGPSAVIVFGGTAGATLLRCGFGDVGAALGRVVRLPERKFDAGRARANLAAQVQAIQRDGLVRAQPAHFGDAEFDEATDALIATRSVAAVLERHDSHRARRLAQSERAVQTLAQAAELAPVFGLAGTLISLSQLPTGGVAAAGLTAAISMAVLTTLYGLLAANLILAPLARIVERTARAEEIGRQAVIDWLAEQLAQHAPAAPAVRRVA